MSEYQSFEVFLRICDFLVVPIILYLGKSLYRWREETRTLEFHKNRLASAQRLGVQALLRDRICQSGNFFIDQGAIPANIKDSLLQMGDAYFDLGGNGEGHKVIEAIKTLPVDDKVLKRRKDKEDV